MTDNVTNIRSAFTAFAQGDMDTLKQVFSPDIVWHEPGHSSISGDYQGLDATLGFFGELFERSGGTFKAELLDCGEIAPDRVSCLINVSGSTSDRSLDQRSVLVFEQRAGRTVEVRNFSSDQHAQDAFWGPSTISLQDASSPTTAVTS